jgi:hypothetical protein
MKTSDVPQDDANMLQGKLKEPIYSLDANGNYTTVPSVGWEPKNEVMKEVWEIVNSKIESARVDVLSRKVSPLAYYIEKNIMDEKLVASYMGIWNFRVKRHLKVKHFNKLSEDMLSRYAKVFNISVEQLLDVESLRAE